MKKYILLISILLFTSLCFADVTGGGITTSNVVIQEEDGTPKDKLKILRVPNTSLTKNASGDYSISYLTSFTETDPLSLHLNQSTPQTISSAGGASFLVDERTIGGDKFVELRGVSLASTPAFYLRNYCGIAGQNNNPAVSFFDPVTVATKTLTYDYSTDNRFEFNDSVYSTGSFIEGTPSLLKLDQTTPQSIINGKPTVEGFIFNNSPTVGAVSAGKLYWDATYKTLDLNLNADVNLQIGQESVIRVVAGENIANGNAVYFDGSSGVFPLAYKAQADTPVKARVKGIATEAITAGNEGFVTAFGNINGLNTSGFTAGGLVYLSGSTAGALTNVQPTAPLLSIIVGRALVINASTGSIYRGMSPNYPISADEIDLHGSVGTNEGHSLTDWLNSTSVGMISGGVVSDAGSQKIAVTAGTGIIAIGTLDTDPVVFCSWAEKTATSVTDQRVTWVAVNYNSGSPVITLYEGSSATDFSVPVAINYQDVFPLGYVTRNGTELYVTNNPRRMKDALGGLVSRFYQTLPLARDEKLGGLIIGEKGTRNITLSSGKLWDRQNSFVIDAIDTSVGGAPTKANTFSTWFRGAVAGTFTETENQTQWPNTKYDDNSGTLADVTANKYANLWWYTSTEGKLAMVYGRSTYTNAASAALGTVPNTLPLPVNTHYRLIGRTTFQNSGGTFVAIDSVFNNTFASSAATSHNNLSGLQGGTLAEYYHLTSAQHTIATQAATTSLSGYLTDTDWDTFNNKQDALTFGIANTNKVQIDAADVADNDYAKFTASGLEGRSYAEVLSDIGAEPVKGADDNYVTDAEKVVIGNTSGTNTGDNSANTSSLAIADLGSTNTTNLIINGGLDLWSDGTQAVDQQQINSGSNAMLGDLGGTEYRQAQSFQITKTYITAAEVRQGGAGIGAPAGNWTLRIETDNAGVPSGNLADANATVTVTPPGTNTIIKGTFATPFFLATGTTYWLVIECANQLNANYWNISYTSPSVYANGVKATKTGANWAAEAANDLYFKIYETTWTPPDGWVVTGTPTVFPDTGDIGYGGSYSAKILSVGAAEEGINYTLSGLKASTTYSVTARMKATAGGDAARMFTTGAGTNMADTDSTSATWETKTGTFIVDAAGTSVVLNLTAAADGDIVWFDGVKVNEGENAFAFDRKLAEEETLGNYFNRSTVIGWSIFTTSHIYTMKIGKRIFVDVNISGTSNTTNISFTVPYTSTSSPLFGGLVFNVWDNGVKQTVPGYWTIASSGTLVTVVRDLTNQMFTAANTKTVQFSFSYESV